MNMNNNIDIHRLQKAVDHLSKLATGEDDPYFIQFGSCMSVYRTCYIDLEVVVDFSKYPDFSGISGFPLPSPDPETDPQIYYFRGCDNGTLWDISHPQGKERRAFCGWCAGQISIRIKKLKEKDCEIPSSS